MNFRKKTYGSKAVYIVDGSRTPFLKAGSGPGDFSASDLAVACSRPLFLRLPVSPDMLDEVIFGSVMPGPDEANIARVISLRLGCGDNVPAWTVQRNCASGMQALDTAARNIAAGNANLILAGGAESMSHAPVLYNHKMVHWLGALSRQRKISGRLRQMLRFRPAMLKPVIGLLRGLTDPVAGLSMGQTAENLASQFGISRESMDDYAVRSHKRLANALDEGFLEEIEPLYTADGRCYTEDDGLRRDSSVNALARLKPVFDRGIGRVTAGNSAQITDGAASLLLASEKAVNQYNLPVLGRISDSQWAGLSPASMGLGPVHAASPILKRHKLQLDDIDYWEINEAFAAQVLACQAAWRSDEYCSNELGLKSAAGNLSSDRLNVDGGGVSLGHPVGASGARIVLHLLQVLKRNDASRGIASLCIGGGQGGAMLIERDSDICEGDV